MDLGDSPFPGHGRLKTAREVEEEEEAVVAATLASRAAAGLEGLQQHASWKPLLGSLRNFAQVCAAAAACAQVCWCVCLGL